MSHLWLQLLAALPLVRGAGQDLDPCSLLTPGDVALLMRDSVAAGVRNGRSCRWKPATGPGSVTVQITPTNGSAVYDRELKLLGADQTLTDLGDRAFVTGTIVGVQAGDRYISVGVAPNIPKSMPRPAAAIALARTAIARVPR